MRPSALVSLVLGTAGAASCLVPTFDVKPLPSQSGGADTGEAGARNALMGGAGNAPGAAGSNAQSGSAAGGTRAVGGAAGASGAGEVGGAGGAGGQSASGPDSLVPTRIGFSVFHDSASGSDNASSHLADATFSKPSGTKAGDFILVFFGADHALSNLSSSHLAQLGWTLHDQHEDYGQDGQATYFIYKFAGQSEPADIVFNDINSPGGGNGVQGLLSVYRGVDSAAPINAYDTVIQDSGSDTSVSVVTPTPAITTTRDDCLLIAGLSPDSQVDAPSIAVWPQGFDQNRISVTNPPAPYPYGWANIYAAERAQATAGQVPASFFSWRINYGDKAYFGALSFVLALAPAAAP